MFVLDLLLFAQRVNSNVQPIPGLAAMRDL